MSVTGPGCAHCDGGRVTTSEGDVRPCDGCGGLSRFARPDAHRGVPVTNARGEVVGYAGRGVAPEDDWRPLPSCAEVLAHNARTGGDCYGAWLWLQKHAGAESVEVIYIAVDGDSIEIRDGNSDRVRLGQGEDAGKVRPITRRGGALPWPEVPR